MKKILTVCILALFIGCASTSTVKKNVPAPPPAPTQEEIIKQAEDEAVVDEVTSWWAMESVLFTMWLSAQMGAYVEVETQDILIAFENKLVYVWLKVTSATSVADIYITATKNEKKWQIVHIMVDEKARRTPPKADAHDETTEVTPHEEDL